MRNHKRAARRRARTSKHARPSIGNSLAGQGRLRQIRDNRHADELARVNQALYGRLNTI